MKIVTLVGTRPEIIRLSATIERLDSCADQVFAHTGQNFDYELSDVFFEDLGLRRPDVYLGSKATTLAKQVGRIFEGVEELLMAERPDAFLVLGDTNSGLAALIAKRMQVPVYHMEAGNRSFDENVPEEINRRLIDHISDFNLVYTEHARRNLLAEGLPARRIHLTGSPMAEVLGRQSQQIEASDVLERHELKANRYFLASLHRQENVDQPARLQKLLSSLALLAERHGFPLLVSTHPRTRAKLEQIQELPGSISFHKPWGFHDYLRLQRDAACVISDSGSISEEAAIMGFPAVTIRDAIERPEALDAGSIVMTGLGSGPLLAGVELAMSAEHHREVPSEYEIQNCSSRTVNFILSTYHRHAEWAGLRPLAR